MGKGACEFPATGRSLALHLPSTLRLQMMKFLTPYQPQKEEAHPMTMNQAAALRVKWKQQADRSPCGHLSLELEWDGQVDSTGNYVYIV